MYLLQPILGMPQDIEGATTHLRWRMNIGHILMLRISPSKGLLRKGKTWSIKIIELLLLTFSKSLTHQLIENFKIQKEDLLTIDLKRRNSLLSANKR